MGKGVDMAGRPEVLYGHLQGDPTTVAVPSPGDGKESLHASPLSDAIRQKQAPVSEYYTNFQVNAVLPLATIKRWVLITEIRDNRTSGKYVQPLKPIRNGTRTYRSRHSG